MEYKQVRLRESTYFELLKIVNELQIKKGEKVSFSDAIDFLIKSYKDKKIEVKF